MANSKTKLDLTEFVRTPKLEDVPLDSIAEEEGKTTDQHILKLYRQYCRGKLPSVLTRVDIETIRPGVFKKAEDGSVQQFDFEAEQKYVEWASYEIRCDFKARFFIQRHSRRHGQ